MPLRPPARASPAATTRLGRLGPGSLFLLGAAAAVWLRRRRETARPALPPGPPLPASGPAPDEPSTVARPPARRPTGRFARRSEPASGRFTRSSEPRPIDIVTVVDDLLGTTR